MPFSTKSMRGLIERYERWFMLGLVVFLLVIFTVTDQISASFMGGGGEAGPGMDERAGSFYINPKTEVEVTYGDFNRAQSAVRVWQMLTFGQQEPSDLDIWSHLILMATAEAEGIRVGNAELRDAILGQPALAQLVADKEQYRKFLRERLNMSIPQFEESIRAALTAARVRQLYIDSYFVAPPATRDDLATVYASDVFEYVDLSWAALDAEKFIEKVGEDLEDADDKDKVLAEFFAKDPGVKADTQAFRNKRKFGFEMLYANHERLTAENLARAKEMFFKAWPQYGKSEDDRKVALDFGGDSEIRRFYDDYSERLIKLEGRTLEELTKQAEEKVDAAKKDDGSKPDENEPNGNDPDKNDPDNNDPDNNDPDKNDEPNAVDAAARNLAIQTALRDIGSELCRPRVIRELELRRIFRLMHNDAFDNPNESLKKIYDRLVAVDDPENPLCSTEPGKGLFVYRKPEKELTREEIQDLEDGSHTFGLHVAVRITPASAEKLPYVSRSAEPLGTFVEGRMFLRVTKVVPESAKTFEELTALERSRLVDDYYKPTKAREMAKEALVALRKRVDEGNVKPDGFKEAAEALGARVFENESVVADTGYIEPPDDNQLFPSEFKRMRDRYFLRNRLGSILASDRIKKEDERIKPGSWLDVEVRSDSDDIEEDPGSAYLILLLERTKPNAATLPEDKLSRARMSAVQSGMARERNRWGNGFEQLFADFQVTFSPEMKERIDAAFERRNARAARQNRLGMAPPPKTDDDD
ncbi:MAG: hypothetical protein AAGD14_08750 [Planctomycetota bacterium]